MYTYQAYNYLFILKVLVTVNRNTNEGDKLKEIMRTVGVKVIRDQLAQYIRELKQGVYGVALFVHCRIKSYWCVEYMSTCDSYSYNVQ